MVLKDTNADHRCSRTGLTKPALISAVPKRVLKIQRWSALSQKGLKKPMVINAVSEWVQKTNADQRCFRIVSKNQRFSALFQRGFEENRRRSILSENGVSKNQLWSSLCQNGFKKPTLISAVSETLKKTNADHRCLKMCFEKPALINAVSERF